MTHRALLKTQMTLLKPILIHRSVEHQNHSSENLKNASGNQNRAPELGEVAEIPKCRLTTQV